MAWGSKTTIMDNQSVQGTMLYSSYVTLGPGEIAHVQVTGAFPSSAVADLGIYVYGTLDASSETSDTDAMMMMVLPRVSSTTRIISFYVGGVYKFRVGCVRITATDTITTYVYSRINGVAL